MKPSEFLETRELCSGHAWMKNNKPTQDPSDCDYCCTLGAVKATIGDRLKYNGFIDALRNVIGVREVSIWNDRHDTTKEDVLAALRETERRLGL